MDQISDDVCLQVGNESFIESKELLSSHSAYFRAMFSGNYREAAEGVISLQVVDAAAIKEILTFVRTGSVTTSDVRDQVNILKNATFLQVDKLVSYLEHRLADSIAVDTWLLILEAAESTHCDDLARLAAGFGLFNLPAMLERVELIPNLDRLHWYLSHSHLVSENEIEVFELGVRWISYYGVHSDAIFVILGSLDLERLREKDLKRIAKSKEVTRDQRASSLSQCLLRIAQEYEVINSDTVSKFELTAKNEFPCETYAEVKRLTDNLIHREAKKTPCITASVAATDSSYRDTDPDYIYRWSETDKELVKWLKVSEGLWGWSWVVWGLRRLVVAGGEYRRGSGRYECRIRVYDTLNSSWTKHDEKLSPRRHAGVAILGDVLYLIGGVGSFRMILRRCTAYDLVKRTSYTLPSLPEFIQSPACAVFKGTLYVAGQTNLYRMHNNEGWNIVMQFPSRAGSLLSYKSQLLFVQTGRSECWKITDSNEIELVRSFKNHIAGICCSGNKLVAFTNTLMKDHCFVEVAVNCDQTANLIPKHNFTPDCLAATNVACHTVSVERCDELQSTKLKYHGTSGCHALHIVSPPVKSVGAQSEYVTRYLDDIREDD